MWGRPSGPLPHSSRPVTMRLVDARGFPGSGPADWAAALWARARAAWVPLAVGAVLLAGAAVRFWGLGAKSLWFDETYSVFIARQPLAEIPRLLQTYDTHPPLHYVLLHFWIALFGSGEVAVRVPSVLASLGAILLTFFLGRRLAGDRVGVLAAALLAVSPFQVMSAQEARMYPFLTLFGAGASYALWLALEEGGRRHWIAYVLFMALALYTHHFGFLLVLTHGLYLLFSHRSHAAARGWLCAMVGVAAAYLPLAVMLVWQFQTAWGWPLIRPPFGIGAVTDALGMFSFGGGLFGMGTYFRRGALPLEYRAALLLPFMLLAAYGAAALDSARKRAFVLGYWLLPVLLTAAVSLRWNIFYERYFSFVLPAFFVLLAAGILFLAGALPRPGRSAVLTGLLLVLASFNLPALVDVYRAAPAYDWRGAARYLTAQARPDDFILYVPAFTRIPFEHYYQGPQARMGLNPKEMLSTHQLAAQGKYKLRTGVEPERVAAIAKSHPRLWIVATIPIGYEARMRIAKILDPHFREVDGRTFGQVFVFIWESRLYGKAARE